MVVSEYLASMIEGVLESCPRLEAGVWGHIVWKGRSAGRTTIAKDSRSIGPSPNLTGDSASCTRNGAIEGERSCEG